MRSPPIFRFSGTGITPDAQESVWCGDLLQHFKQLSRKILGGFRQGQTTEARVN